MSGTLFDLGEGRPKHRGRKPDASDLDPGLSQGLTKPPWPIGCQTGPGPLARTTDPLTSHLAASAIVPSLDGLRRAAVEAVRRWPGRTATELSRLAGHADPRTLNRRLGECERLGAVRRGEERACSVTGRMAAVWTLP